MLKLVKDLAIPEHLADWVEKAAYKLDTSFESALTILLERARLRDEIYKNLHGCTEVTE